MIIFYFGEDTFSIAQKIDELKSEFKTKNPQAGTEHLAAGDFSDSDLSVKLREALQGQGLFATKKLVVLNDLLTSVKNYPISEEYLLNFLKSPVPDITLVISQQDKFDRRLKLFKALEKSAQGKEFEIPNGSDLKNWIHAYLQKNNFSIEDDALGEFMNLLGQNEEEDMHDLWQVHSELQKLMLLNSTGKITVSEIRAVVRPNISQNIFTLTNLFAEGRASEATGFLETLMRGGADQKAGAIQIIGGLAQQIRSMLLVKDLEAETPAKIAGRLGWKEGRVWINSKLAKKFSKNKLVLLLKDLRALDLRLKTSEESPKLLLGLFLQKSKV